MSRHNRNHSGGAPGVNLGLIITPMLDMSFQILAFFIMTYHPSSLEAHIPGSLVPAEEFQKKDKGGKNEQLPSVLDPPSLKEDELDPVLSEAVQVKVKAVVRGQEVGDRTPGKPSQVFIKLSTDTQEQMLADMLADPNVEFKTVLKQLDAHLRDIAKKKLAKENVKIVADNDLQQKYVMQVYDACKQAGFDKVHFVPPPLLAKKIR